MKAIIRALIGFLALSVCLVLAAPSAAARTTPASPGAVTAATRVARYRAVHPSGGRTIRRACRVGGRNRTDRPPQIRT